MSTTARPARSTRRCFSSSRQRNGSPSAGASSSPAPRGRLDLLACTLGQKACRDNFTVVYRRLPRLFAELELAHGDDRLPRLFRSLVKAVLLILDGWGPDG